MAPEKTLKIHASRLEYLLNSADLVSPHPIQTFIEINTLTTRDTRNVLWNKFFDSHKKLNVIFV